MLIPQRRGEEYASACGGKERGPISKEPLLISSGEDRTEERKAATQRKIERGGRKRVNKDRQHSRKTFCQLAETVALRKGGRGKKKHQAVVCRLGI